MLKNRVYENFEDKNICIIGLGYVGLTLAVSMAEVGFKVWGVEKIIKTVENLNKGKAHFYEPKLEEKMIELLRKKDLIISSEFPDDQKKWVYIITVGTPLNEENKIRLDMVEAASHQVGEHLKDESLVILRSTLKLGTTREIVLPILKSYKKRLDIAFCPERTVEGQALTELRHLPQIIGGLTFEAGLRASKLFQFITSTVIKVNEPETAEMIKMIDNTQRDVSFAFSNEIALACDASGISAVEVIKAGKLGYPRTNLFMPGPVGGPCLSKDPHILSEGLKKFDTNIQLATIARKINEKLPYDIRFRIKDIISEISDNKKVSKIGLLGLAFKGKPATDDLRGTMSIPIIKELKEEFPNADYYGFDPMVNKENTKTLNIIYAEKIEDAFENSDIVLILNNHKYFEDMPLSKYMSIMNKPGLLYDLWNNFSAADLDLPDGLVYTGLGNLSQSNIYN